MVKTPEDCAIIREGGRLLGTILEELIACVRPGITTAALDALAEEKIYAVSGRPSFKGYAPRGVPPFPSTICASINEEVVHAPAVPARRLKAGDIFSIDIGMEYKGRFTDTAVTIPVGKVSAEAQKLIAATHGALEQAIRAFDVREVTTRTLGKLIQSYVERRGFYVVRDLVGHGVGYAVHEPPQIPNYVDPASPEVTLKEGMVIAIEPMVNAGTHEVVFESDGWTVRTRDNSLSAHFEHTIIVTTDGCDVVTRRPTEDVARRT